MSWKLNTLAIVAFGILASSLAIGGQYGAFSKVSCPMCCATDSDGNHTAAKDEATDSDLIKLQKTCPVTDKKLGSMGQPVKVVAKGHTVFLCCMGCKQKFLANVDTYLKKLDEKKSDEKKSPDKK